MNEQVLLRFQQRVIPADELLLADRHLSTCADCAQRLAALTELSGTVKGIQLELAQAESESCSYFTFEQKTEYVNDKLSTADMALARQHLEHCSECCLAIAELQAVRQSLRPDWGIPPGTQKALSGVRAWFEVPVTRWVWRSLGTMAMASMLFWFASSNWRREQFNAPAQPALPAVAQPAQGSAVETSRSSTTMTMQAVNEVPVRGPRIALLDEGRQVVVDETGKLSGLEGHTPVVQAAVKQALMTQQVKVSTQMVRMRTDTVELLSKGRESADFMLLSPVGQVVQATQPILKWQALSGASSYFVNVYDANLRKVASSDALNVTEWKPASELERGASYYWQVRALRDEQEFFAPAPSAPDAKFKVLERLQLAEIEQTKTVHASHLALGVLYARAGLLEEARAEFKALVAANPRSPVAKRILQNFEHQYRNVIPSARK